MFAFEPRFAPIFLRKLERLKPPELLLVREVDFAVRLDLSTVDGWLVNSVERLVTLEKRRARALQHVNDPFVLKKLHHFGRQKMLHAKLATSARWKESVMSKFIYNTQADTLPKVTRKECIRLATGKVPGVTIIVDSANFGGGVVSKISAV